MRSKQLCQNLMEDIQQLTITLRTGLNDKTITFQRVIELIKILEYKQQQLSDLISSEREE